MMGSRRRQRSTINVWPGYVDALSALLMLVIFMLLIYVVSQLYLSQALSDRNAELSRLDKRLADISRQLGLTKEENAALTKEMGSLQEDYGLSLARNDRLQEDVGDLSQETKANEKQIRVLLGTKASLQQDIDALRKLRRELEQKVATRDQSLDQQQRQIGALRDRSKKLEASLADEQERTQLSQQTLEKKELRIDDLVAVVEEGEKALKEGKDLSAAQRARIKRLSKQIAALQDQLNEITAALKLQKGMTSSKDARIAELGKRLNTLLAKRVNKLEQYQSEFFGRLREILKGNKNVRIVGDRFLLPSELLFASGSATINDNGRKELDKLAGTLLDVTDSIPDDIDWILRVDGHTDRIPINTKNFPSNWELSTARAVAVVRYLSDKGVPQKHMAAAGFGQFSPVAKGNSPEALQENRRIEIKLTDR